MAAILTNKCAGLIKMPSENGSLSSRRHRVQTRKAVCQPSICFA
ncbi:hypothetical protein NMA510612_0941 [Neisseria meningitidis]|uniref:Uncharacterized protein n=1 Tax=Neisseria meningitidis TaxID=487 RepID=X5F7X1_NEIME|nr:hypothetical protein NMA510612_0941 [Neisseria meningitidis]